MVAHCPCWSEGAPAAPVWLRGVKNEAASAVLGCSAESGCLWLFVMCRHCPANCKHSNHDCVLLLEAESNI